MLQRREQATRELDFLRTFDDMDITIRKAQLIGEIESRSRDSEYAGPDEIVVIQQDLKGLREDIRKLDGSKE